MFEQFICPLDHSPLRPLDDTAGCWQCPQGHSFDRAKEGYLHLLPAQFKRSRDPGDSKAMVQARRRFLEGGYYQPLNQALQQLVAESAGIKTLLDAGCGEGFYLRAIQQRMPTLDVVGNDISKWAVQAAAKRHPSGRYVVASNARLPLATHSVDMLWSLFGFAAEQEFHRVLAPNGILLTVDAGPQHLIQLKQRIYQSLPAKADVTPELAGFQLCYQANLDFDFALTDKGAIADLLTMTPHLYRASRSGLAAVQTLSQLDLSAQMVIRMYRPQALTTQTTEDI